MPLSMPSLFEKPPLPNQTTPNKSDIKELHGDTFFAVTDEKLNIRGIEKTFTLFDILPKQPKSDASKILFAPGCACDAPIYSHALQKIAETGYPITTFNHPETISKNRPLSEIYQDTISIMKRFLNHDTGHTPSSAELSERQSAMHSLVDAAQDTLAEKSDHIASIAEKKFSSEKIVGIAHSEGCINIVDAAIQHPDQYKGLVLIAPAGLIGPDSLQRLSGGFFGEWLASPATLKDIPETPEERERKHAASQKTLEHVASAPISTAREVLGISESQIQEKLKKLRTLGIGITIIAPADDRIFPQELMQKLVTADIIDGYFVVRGNHSTLETGLYTPAIEQSIEFFEKKEKRRNTTMLATPEHEDSSLTTNLRSSSTTKH